ncbi:pyridoxamine 5'-phosphate oxidase family protein [Planctomycetales bacterium ZRK34]|nr:pyridoxamine 5'-phosphate oxidase family protein [Planctomycetales bacterium ZRK34]
MNAHQFHSTLRDFLQRVPTLCLATVDDDHNAHAANLNFVADDDLHIYWVSHPDSAHTRHHLARPRVAIAAYVPFEQPNDIRGLQAHGHVAPIDDKDFKEVFRLFREKFPYAIGFEEHIRNEQFYRFTPTWVRWIDNSINFGFKVESEWPMKI